MEAMTTKILTMSVTGSVVILLVLAARLMLKKMPKAFSYVLWAVVLFRLICPVSLSTGLSLFGLFDTEQAVTEYTEPVQQTATAPVVNTPREEIHVSDGTVHEAPEIEVTAKPVREITPETVLTVAWLTGAAGMAGYSLVRYIELKKKLTEAARLRDNIYLADHIDTAFVLGIVRPKIYIPSAVNETELSHIIAHEEHHIRRFDHVTRLLGYLALCVHWFNPLVWAAFILSGKDMEMSCDEAVIKKLGSGERAKYSVSLVALSSGRRFIADVPVAFAEGDTKRRILNLARMKKPRVWISLILALVCLLFTVACGTNPEVAKPPKKEETAEAASGIPEELVEAADVISDGVGDPVSAAPSTQQNGTTTAAGEKKGKKQIVLVDDVPKDTYDVFEEVYTPYEFFQKVTAEDIESIGGLIYFGDNSFQLEFGSMAGDTAAKIGELATMFNSIKRSEITELPESREIRWSDCDVDLDFTCDGTHVDIMYYKDGYAELAFTADSKKADAKPSFYGRVKWIVINDELNSFFEDQISRHGGVDGPKEVAITEEPVTIKGDDIGNYYITTELDKLIVTVTVPHGVDFGGFLSYEGSGSAASDGLISSDSFANENEYVFRMTPMFSSSIIRFYADSVAGCTVTIRGEKGYT